MFENSILQIRQDMVAILLYTNWHVVCHHPVWVGVGLGEGSLVVHAFEKKPTGDTPQTNSKLGLAAEICVSTRGHAGPYT